MHELDNKVIPTPAGDYRVTWYHDEDPGQPYDEGFCLYVYGRREYVDIDETHGKMPELVEDAIRTGGHYREDCWDWELRSGAAIMRYMKLKGFKGVTLVDERYQPVEPSANRREHVVGVAWENSEVSGQIDEEAAKRNVAIDLVQWHAWGEGDVFGWVLTDPTGNEVESCWGYYGYWEGNYEERDYTLSVAEGEAQADAKRRVKQANQVGAGIVGLI
jgi:hypothetical protein